MTGLYIISKQFHQYLLPDFHTMYGLRIHRFPAAPGIFHISFVMETYAPFRFIQGPYYTFIQGIVPPVSFSRIPHCTTMFYRFWKAIPSWCLSPAAICFRGFSPRCYARSSAYPYGRKPFP